MGYAVKWYSEVGVWTDAALEDALSEVSSLPPQWAEVGCEDDQAIEFFPKMTLHRLVEASERLPRVRLVHILPPNDEIPTLAEINTAP